MDACKVKKRFHGQSFKWGVKMANMGKKMGFSRFGMVKERHRKTFESAASQGKVDPQMLSLCKFVAGTEKFYTSSCCSGRILFLERRGNRKIDTFFHRKWHRESERYLHQHLHIHGW